MMEMMGLGMGGNKSKGRKKGGVTDDFDDIDEMVMGMMMGDMMPPKGGVGKQRKA